MGEKEPPLKRANLYVIIGIIFSVSVGIAGLDAALNTGRFDRIFQILMEFQERITGLECNAKLKKCD